MRDHWQGMVGICICIPVTGKMLRCNKQAMILHSLHHRYHLVSYIPAILTKRARSDDRIGWIVVGCWWVGVNTKVS